MISQTAKASITRNNVIIMKALAYAIVAIERLPEQWQEWGDKEDMRALLDAMAGSAIYHDHFITEARGFLERRGFAMEDGRLVPAPREAETVVPFK